MRCYICDRAIDEPQFNTDLDAYEPCDPCMAIIMDAAGVKTDHPYAEDDELPEENWTSVFKEHSRREAEEEIE